MRRRLFFFSALFALAASGVRAERVNFCADIDTALAAAPSEKERSWLQDWRRACRLPTDDLTPSRALTLLRGEPLAVERDRDALTIVARTDGDEARLCCTFQERMTRLGASDLWALRYRLDRLDEAMIFLVPPSDYGRSSLTPLTWRGPKAPEAPQPAEKLSGEIIRKDVRSEALGETRRVEIYLPKDYKAAPNLHVLLVADGLGKAPYLVERLVEAGALPPFAMIGLPSGREGVIETPANKGITDLRAADYLPWRDKAHDRFRRHQRFVVDELLPALRKDYGLPAEAARIAVSGHSNGAVFALFTALDRPGAVGAAIVNSAGSDGSAFARGRACPCARFFLSAGLYEPGFSHWTRRYAESLAASGYDVAYKNYVAGHAQDQWDVALIDGLKALFGGGE